MVLKITTKDNKVTEFTNIEFAFTADNFRKEKNLIILTETVSECYSMSEIEDFEIIGCGHCK